MTVACSWVDLFPLHFSKENQEHVRQPFVFFHNTIPPNVHFPSLHSGREYARKDHQGYVKHPQSAEGRIIRSFMRGRAVARKPGYRESHPVLLLLRGEPRHGRDISEPQDFRSVMEK